jgi:hypothetical protein
MIGNPDLSERDPNNLITGYNTKAVSEVKPDLSERDPNDLVSFYTAPPTEDAAVRNPDLSGRDPNDLVSFYTAPPAESEVQREKRDVNTPDGYYLPPIYDNPSRDNGVVKGKEDFYIPPPDVLGPHLRVAGDVERRTVQPEDGPLERCFPRREMVGPGMERRANLPNVDPTSDLGSAPPRQDATQRYRMPEMGGPDMKRRAYRRNISPPDYFGPAPPAPPMRPDDQ